LQREPNACPVTDEEKPSIRLRRPTGGEVLTGGSPFRIQWESDDNVDVASHEIRLSTDGGSTFPMVLATGLAGASQSYDWQVPGNIAPSRTAVIQVTATDAAGNSASATSDLLALLGAGFTPNSTVTFEYDGLNRVSKARYADGLLVEYTYDASGNLIEVRSTRQ
jgi:YD repeat-containing protein